MLRPLPATRQGRNDAIIEVDMTSTELNTFRRSLASVVSLQEGLSRA